MYPDCIKIDVPEYGLTIRPGCDIKLGRFETEVWTVCYGWYKFAGNREIFGFYLSNKLNPSDVRPLQKIDLDDIYFVES